MSVLGKTQQERAPGVCWNFKEVNAGEVSFELQLDGGGGVSHLEE